MAPSEAVVHPQLPVSEETIPALDPELFQPTPEALTFLSETVSEDADEMRARVEEVQKE